MLDHDVLVKHLRKGNMLTQIAAGFLSCGRIILEGGFHRYFRHAWRFGLFFVFPFLLTALGLILSAEIAFLPHLLGLP
ncbi:hypothetical protein, partial [Klebsiella pneumoniae]